ncbi:MAG: YeiH family protein [Gammaproteobacteria bacterium]
MNNQRLSLSIYALGILFCITPWASPGLALATGLGFALMLDNPYRARGARIAKYLLQASVVLLGFGMSLGVMLRAGANGLLFAAVTIVITFTLGWMLARLLKINRKTSLLISAGTAICGGSAIAAVGSAVDADHGEMSVAMGAVFMLNAVALYLFPPLGHLLGLTQDQFGTWAGVAIHDISSVVGAAAEYGNGALHTATVVKLSRALWIVPVALAAALLFQRDHAEDVVQTGRRRLNLPWFIGLFLLAALASSCIPGIAQWTALLSRLAKIGLTITLFFIGASLSRGALQAVGYKPLLQGVLLWLFISIASLVTILFTVH